MLALVNSVVIYILLTLEEGEKTQYEIYPQQGLECVMKYQLYFIANYNSYI